MEDLVSIITPAYNASKYISETINSVLTQTYDNWEMIIINDCSLDDTIDIVHKYMEKDKRIKLINLTKNMGVAEARNKGIDIAKGKFVAFLDSDDLWIKNKLQIQVNFMNENNCILSYTGYDTFNSNTKEIIKRISVPKKMSKKDIMKNTIIGCLTVMVNIEIGGKFSMPNLNHSEDQCTWISIICDEKYALGINQSLSLYRVGNKSMSKNKLKAAKKQWLVYRKHHNLYIFKCIYYFSMYAVNVLRR